MDVEKSIELLDNLIGMVEDNQDNDYDEALKFTIQTIRELQEDCNRYHEWGMHEGYEEAKEKYKCKYWNTEHKECSQGNTIVIEEVCEWEKGSSGYVGYPAYYSKCCTTDSNGLEMQTHIIADWKYCPYCGKKIKVVK